MVDTCVNCGANLSPSSTSCPSCGSPRRSPSTSGGGGGFCGGCGGPLASKFAPCPKCGHVKTTFAPPPQSGGFCGGCGGPLASKFAPCPKCGHVKTTFSPPGLPPQGGVYKSSGTTLLLAILPAIFLATLGIGQIYVGKVARGIGLMIGGWVSLGLSLALSYFLNMLSYSRGAEQAVLNLSLIVIGMIIVFIVLLVWSIVDANRKCKMYNEFLSTNGRPPW